WGRSAVPAGARGSTRAPLGPTASLRRFGRRARLGHAQVALEEPELVAQSRRLLELEVLGGGEHLLPQRLDALGQVLLLRWTAAGPRGGALRHRVVVARAGGRRQIE